MKSVFMLASLLAAAQAQFSISAPAAGTTVTPGQKVTVQVIVPISTSNEGGEAEISLAIGVINCGTSACPAASADLGQLVFVGKFEPTGRTGSSSQPQFFENITIAIPDNISGKASIQIQRNFATSFPGHAVPGVEYASIAVQTGSGGGTTPSGSINIHPNGDNSKCVGILGGAYTNGAAVDIYDCNASATQKWKFNGNALTSVNSADGSQWCLDAGVQSTWTAGLKMKIWQCLPNLPQQTWTPVTSSGNIKLNAANFCLDLTNGDKTNRNILQIWTCGGGNANQIWSVTSA